MAHLHDQNEFWEEEGKAQKCEIKELEELIRGYKTAILSKAFGDSRTWKSNALQDRPCMSARSMLQGLQGRGDHLWQRASFQPCQTVRFQIQLSCQFPHIILQICWKLWILKLTLSSHVIIISYMRASRLLARVSACLRTYEQMRLNIPRRR